VEAGNCYLNRHTTGAIVGRQPFGGWKRSAFGPTAKAGGPNYLFGLRRFRDRQHVDVVTAAASYERAMASHFGRSTELAGLKGESNELRYRPYLPGVVLRVGLDTDPIEVAKAAAAASITGTPLRCSSRQPLEAPPGVAFELESAEALAAMLRSGYRGRVRQLGRREPEVSEAAAAAGVTVLDEPICSEGRVELVRWLREQTITRTLHRYGNVVYSRRDFIRPTARPLPPTPARG
jgi:RHH-type transcriptional regulator, proline utilization regulon repressor / proline dehydrogenase / delta 1-pyrroline-5-carboxylate dehydrogenase